MMNKAADSENSYFLKSLTFGVACVVVIVGATACRSSSQQMPAPTSPAPITSTVSAVNWSPKDCDISPENAAGISHDLDSDVHAADNLVTTASHMLVARQFDQLDCLADHYRTSKARFSGGAWRLHVLYTGLSQPVMHPQHATEQDWLDHISLLDQWISAKPKSLTARVAQASTYSDYAWTARGEGYSDSVTDSGWKLLQERMSRASDLLNGGSPVPAKDAQWYYAMLGIATTGETWELEKARALFEEAYKFEPGYFYYGRQFGYYLEPKWAGEADDTAKFAAEISDRVGGDEGDAYYYRVAVGLICYCEDSPKFNWPRMVRGFKAAENLYGPSLIDLNEVAYMASHYNSDPIVANEVMTRIGDQRDEQIWEREEEFDSIKQWAAKSAPLARQRNVMIEGAKANMETAAGLRYRDLFAKKYTELVRKCMTPADAVNLDKFETLTVVGAKGTVEDMKIYWNGYAAVCVYQKLLVSKQKHTKLFPPPPHAPYSVKLELSAADIGPVASK